MTTGRDELTPSSPVGRLASLLSAFGDHLDDEIPMSAMSLEVALEGLEQVLRNGDVVAMRLQPLDQGNLLCHDSLCLRNVAVRLFEVFVLHVHDAIVPGSRSRRNASVDDATLEPRRTNRCSSRRASTRADECVRSPTLRCKASVRRFNADRYLRTGLVTRHNFSESRDLLAGRILRAAYYGERDEWRLARDAVDYLCSP